jgi:serine/threonine-protein kinase
VKIVDFGIAKAQNALTHTRAGTIKGKVAYMAPEQARGEHVDRRADIFAVGVMLWEAATGARPWDGVPSAAVLTSMLARRFPSPRSVNPEISPVLEAIIQKAVAHDRKDRHGTAAELQNEIEAYIATTGEGLQRRELGRLVSSHFEAERARIKAIIEQKLRAPVTDGERLPIIDESTPPIALDPQGPSPRSEPTRPAANTVETGLAPPRASAAPPTRPPPARRGFFVPVGVALVAAVLLASGLSLQRSPLKAEAAAPPVAPAAAGNALPSAAAAPAQRSSTVELRFSAFPLEARLFLDDAALAGNPFKGNLPRDAAAHRLRAEAPGFVEQVESVTLDQDQSVGITLARTPAAPAAPEARPPLSGARPRRSRILDSANPYAP